MTKPPDYELYGFWRTSATYRVRVALNLKGLVAHERIIDLDKGEQRDPAFLAINPLGAIPALMAPGHPPLTESLAILEFLDETHPAPPLLPADPHGRARVRALALMVACEGHPMLVPRVRRYLDHELNVRDAQQTAWRKHWTVETLAALEGHLAGHKDTGRFCHGDTPTLADICLAGHAPVAGMLQLDLKPGPTVKRIYETSMAMPEFSTAHPLAQPDTPEAMRPKQ